MLLMDAGASVTRCSMPRQAFSMRCRQLCHRDVARRKQHGEKYQDNRNQATKWKDLVTCHPKPKLTSEAVHTILAINENV